MVLTIFLLFSMATLIQILAWWGLFGRFAFRKPSAFAKATADKPALATENRPSVTVLICARNEAENLKQNLPQILEQHFPKFEVLVVDDDSTDATRNVLEHLQMRYSHLKILRVAPKTSPGKKHALAMGINAAQFEHLVFTDADCRPASKTWLRSMAMGFSRVPSAVRGEQDVEIVLGYGPYLPEPGLLNKWIRFETVQTAMQYFSFAHAGHPYMGVGRNLAWKRHLFRETGGFEAHVQLPSGDDDLFVNAAANGGNTGMCLKPESFVYSRGEKGWKNWLKQKRRHLSAGKKYRFKHRFLLGLLAITQSLHYFLLTLLLLTDFGIISVTFYSIRMASALPIYRKITCQLREKQLLIWFPVFDALLALYYAAFVPLVLISSDDLISWK